MHHVSDYIAGVATLLSAFSLPVAYRSKKAADTSAQEAARSNDITQRQVLEDRVQPYRVTASVYTMDRPGPERWRIGPSDGTDHVGVTVTNGTDHPISAVNATVSVIHGSQVVASQSLCFAAIGEQLPPGSRRTVTLAHADLSALGWPLEHPDLGMWQAPSPTGWNLVIESMTFTDAWQNQWTLPRAGDATVTHTGAEAAAAAGDRRAARHRPPHQDAPGPR